MAAKLLSENTVIFGPISYHQHQHSPLLSKTFLHRIVCTTIISADWVILSDIRASLVGLDTVVL